MTVRIVRQEKPARANRGGVVLRACGKLCGYLTAMPPVADTGQAKAHQCEGGGFWDVRGSVDKAANLQDQIIEILVSATREIFEGYSIFPRGFVYDPGDHVVQFITVVFTAGTPHKLIAVKGRHRDAEIEFHFGICTELLNKRIELPESFFIDDPELAGITGMLGNSFKRRRVCSP